MLARFLTLALVLLSALPILRAADGNITGRLIDAQQKTVANGCVSLSSSSGLAAGQTRGGPEGTFFFSSVPSGEYEITATAPDFSATKQIITVKAGAELRLTIRFLELAERRDAVTVTADVKDIDVFSPDPSIKVFASEDLLDANPGRPGAPLSIPGYPIETASSGIKAPQYFAPGVAGDHGEPIAQYLQVGGYLVPNNLSANAHGNGYADPNIFIGNIIESVQVDGGAYNVREGNHALNLATIYALRTHFDPFLTVTGDHRDVSVATGFNPSDHSWLALEAAYGNGFLDRLEHRKQFKLNAGQILRTRDHTITLFGLGYYGFSYLAGLRPIYGFNSADAANGWQQYPDTIDPRQKDQTHSGLLAVNDIWNLGEGQELQFSGFFRTYNLSLFSNFGDGLIRQSEFRTVTGGSAVYRKRFSERFTLLAGTDYEREAPRRDDLDHYNFFDPGNPSYYGPFARITGSNVTISPISPYVAGEGGFFKYFRYYLGWRRDEIFFSNQDLVTPLNSFSKLVGLNSPKATLTFFPDAKWYLPEVAVSFGKSFFTEDPRTSAYAYQGMTSTVDPVETARSSQLVVSKQIHRTDLKLTLGRETQTAEYGKIDADTGLQFDLGPGRIRYLAATLRQPFGAGWFQATFEQADARAVDSGQVTPEAPRLIGDLLWAYEKLPFHLKAKGEFEYVGRKVVGNGCNENEPSNLNAYCYGTPVKEFRLALTRSFAGGRINAGVIMMLVSGYSGQTTENFATDNRPGYVGPLPAPQNPVAEVVGVRIPSYVSATFTYRFGRGSR